jgi:hypothetical protein
MVFVWLERQSRWHRLRALGESNYVKASVLMPAFGYLLIISDRIQQYLTVRHDWWLSSFPLWRVWMLFYGSFFLAAGSILFSLFCKREIKQYESPFDMATAEKEHVHYQRITLPLRDEIIQLHGRASQWEKSLHPGPQLDVEHNHLGLSDQDFPSAMLIYKWNLFDVGKPRLGIFILMLFCVGLLLLAVPAAVTLLQVTWLAIRHVILGT